MYGRFANSCFEFVFLVLEISFAAVERSLARGSCEGVPQCTVVCVTKVKVCGESRNRAERCRGTGTGSAPDLVEHVSNITSLMAVW